MLKRIALLACVLASQRGSSATHRGAGAAA
jgi:hypothetical protein